MGSGTRPVQNTIIFKKILNGNEGHHHLYSPRDPAPRIWFGSGKNVVMCEDNPFIHESGLKAFQ